MKWIFALLFLLSFDTFAVLSAPAKLIVEPSPNIKGNCNYYGVDFAPGTYTAAECEQYYKNKFGLVYSGPWYIEGGFFKRNSPTGGWAWIVLSGVPVVNTYQCPPDGKPTYTYGPIDLDGSKVCQVPPKTCLMGAVIRVASDGKETCVSNCESAAGLVKTSQYFYQAGPNPSSTAGDIACYGQCSVKTTGGGTQLSSGAWTGSFTFTGANCSVVRPEPTVDSESDTSSNGSATPVDESTTSQGTTDALGQLNGAASAATGSLVQPSATGPDGTSTLHDVAQTVANAANAQIQATSAQNVATGNLISNTTKDLQNAIIKSVGGGGAAAALQAQGNGKLDGIGSAIGAGNGKLDGIQSTLNDISDKLDEPGEEAPFVPGAGSGAFWESVLPESSFTEIKAKQDESIQEMKDLSTEFQDSISFTNLSASGAPEEWTLNMHGTALPFGMGAFQMIIDMGLAAVILLLCALYAIYIITNRK